MVRHIIAKPCDRTTVKGGSGECYSFVLGLAPLVPEGLEGGSRELQSCQSDLGAGEGYGADHLECHHVACTGQPGDQAQSAWVYERQVLLD